MLAMLRGDSTMKRVLVLVAVASFALALESGPEVAMAVHPLQLVACSGSDC
jgi:hypothetical protein